jgi:hypothetical protein
MQEPSMDTYDTGTVLDLPWLERLLLWSIRVWAAYHDEPAAVRWCLERAFNDAGMYPALLPFEKMMRSVFADWQCWPDIRCVRCLQLGKGERELLALFADLEQGRVQPATERLSDLLTYSQVSISQSAALDVVQIFKEAGLSMQQIDVTDAIVKWPPSATVFSELQHYISG